MMNENYKRDFKGIWIPREVWLTEDLSLQEKVFLVEINSLDNSKGCYANNEYFSKFFSISKVRVSEIINSLVQKGYIESLVNQSMGNKRTLVTLAKFSLRPSQTFIEEGLKDSFKHNNTISNTMNNTIREEEDKSSRHSLFKSIEERKKEFETKVEQFHIKYGSILCTAFFDYWTESNSSGKKMRFEDQKFFDIGKRLATWKSRDEKFNSGKVQGKFGTHDAKGNPLPPHLIGFVQ